MTLARASALRARRALGQADREYASRLICRHLVHTHEFRSCRLLGCFLPMDDEVDTTRIIQRAWSAQKRVFVPVTDTHGTMNFCEITPDTIVARSRFGIWEPLAGTIVDARTLDVVVTPLVAFDAACQRIGMGGGHYDRCFHFLRKRRKWLKPKLIGVAYACQEVPSITPNRWDVPLYRVVTERG